MPENSLVTFEVQHCLVSSEALLKTCYWFSRDFACDLSPQDSGSSMVSLSPRHTDSPLVMAEVREQFLLQAMDFELRERVAKQTSDVRDLLLAKAFAESGVLEEAPQGVFGDALEETKPDGMFKILSNG